MATWGERLHQLADFADGQEEVHRQARRQHQIASQPQQPQQLQLISERMESLTGEVQQVQRTQQHMQQTQQQMQQAQQEVQRTQQQTQQQMRQTQQQMQQALQEVQQTLQMQQDVKDNLVAVQRTMQRAENVSLQRIQNSKALHNTALLLPPNSDGVELQHAPASLRDLQHAGSRILERVLRHYNLSTNGNDEKKCNTIKMHIGVIYQ